MTHRFSQKRRMLTLGHPYRGPIGADPVARHPFLLNLADKTHKANNSIASLRRYHKMKFAPHNTLRARRKTEVLVILCRHVAEKQRNSLTSLLFRKIGRPHSRYNRHNQPTLTAEPPSVRTPDRSRTMRRLRFSSLDTRRALRGRLAILLQIPQHTPHDGHHARRYSRLIQRRVVGRRDPLQRRDDRR